MDVFAVIAEPARRTVLDLLAGGPRPAGDVVEELPGLSQPAVSRHLRVLREAGLVHVEVRGAQRIYSLEPAPLAELDAWIDRYRPYWAAHLDALSAHLDRVAAAGPARAGSPRRRTDPDDTGTGLGRDPGTGSRPDPAGAGGRSRRATSGARSRRRPPSARSTREEP